MLAEKFFLVLEMLKSFTSTDGSPIVVSTAQFVPVTLPRRTKYQRRRPLVSGCFRQYPKMVSWRGPSAHIDVTPEPWLIEAAKAVHRGGFPRRRHPRAVLNVELIATPRRQ